MLLMAIREGVASDAAVAEARALLLADARVPEELKEEALTVPEERCADAAAMLSLLGMDEGFGSALRDAVSAEGGRMPGVVDVAPWEDDLPLAASVMSSSGSVDVTESVLGRVDREGSDWVYGSALAAAVREEAGASPLAAADVMVACDLEAGFPVAEALRHEMGRVDVSTAVYERLSSGPALPVGEAVRSEAGTVDVLDTVMWEIGAGSRGLRDLSSVPPAANRSWGAWATAAVAAAVLWVVAPGAMEWNVGVGAEEPIRFAMAAEVIVEDLSYSDTVQVMQTEGDEGALIIWLDEEAVL